MPGTAVVLTSPPRHLSLLRAYLTSYLGTAIAFFPLFPSLFGCYATTTVLCNPGLLLAGLAAVPHVTLPNFWPCQFDRLRKRPGVLETNPALAPDAVSIATQHRPDFGLMVHLPRREIPSLFLASGHASSIESQSARCSWRLIPALADAVSIATQHRPDFGLIGHSPRRGSSSRQKLTSSEVFLESGRSSGCQGDMAADL